MEIESSSSAPIISKKLWKKLKAALYMLEKTITKTKLLLDLHIKLKNGKLARKALTTTFLHHKYTAFTCRCTSNNIDTLFISPEVYTPRNGGSKWKSSQNHSDESHKIEQVIVDVLNDGDHVTTEPSPSPVPIVVSHELCVVESPVQSQRESDQVDKAAEAFIEKFYKQLKQQQITSIESPSPNYHLCHM
ncbi:uncharacterized protein [Rutidosis leptorrhynchoides]|uniref:uncharacterized protein n=1 Tax=Rutidosis leptorrhynchoides TaxID=125765 RepID=UPI003A9A48ED